MLFCIPLSPSTPHGNPSKSTGIALIHSFKMPASYSKVCVYCIMYSVLFLLLRNVVFLQATREHQ